MDKSFYEFYIIGIFSTIAISIAIFSLYFFYNKHNLNQIFDWFFGVLLISPLYMFLAQYLKYRSLHFYTDFSHWAINLYNIITIGKSLNLSQQILYPGTLNYLSVHFVPLIYLLAIPFKLWPYSETIIGLNFLLMISAAIPLYKLALAYRQDRRFALFIAVLLFWYPTFQYTVLYEFEMLRFSIPIILWMLYFWQTKKMIAYYLFLLLAVLVREEVGLTIMMFGLYLIFIEKQRQTGAISALIGLGAFISITQIVMPALSTVGSFEHISTASFSAFGKTPDEVIKNIILHPGLTLSTIFEPVKLANVFMLFLPLLFIPLFAPAVLIATLANLGVCILSGSRTHVSYMLYYLSPSIPFIFFAFIKGWPKFLEVLKNLMGKWSRDRNTDFNSVGMIVVLSGLLVANVFFGPSPFSLQFWFKDIKPAPFKTQNYHYSVYRISDHHRKVEEFCKLIPDSAVVSAQQFLAPRLFKKKGILVFPKLEGLNGTIKADYVFIDKTNNGLYKNSPAYITQPEFSLVEENKDTWKLIKSEGGYFLYKRIGT